MKAQLPTDIVQLICDELFAWEDDSLWHLNGMLGRRAWLSQALRTSKFWYTLGLPLLYRTIDIVPTDEVTLDLLLRTLRRCPNIAALVRTFRPYDRQYRSRDTDSTFRNGFFKDWEGFQFKKAMFEDRDSQLQQRRLRKLTALVKMCSNLDELGIQSHDVQDFDPVLKQASRRIQRLVLESAHRLNTAALVSAADWSNLRSLKFDGSGRFENATRRQGRYLDAIDVACFARMANLVELEILGWVQPQRMRDILHALRHTLRSLTCYQLQPGTIPCDWLAPISGTLRELSLLVQAWEWICDLSSMTAIKVLRIHIMSNSHQRYEQNTRRRPQPRFPRGVERVEWLFLDSTGTPNAAEERVEDLITAFQRSTVPNLKTVVVNVNLHAEDREADWLDFIRDFQLQCTQHDLNRWVVLNQDCSDLRPDDPRDVFALVAHAAFVERQQGRQRHEARSTGAEQSVVGRTARTAVKAWTRCCCIAWLCCCCCPCFRCPHWFV